MICNNIILKCINYAIETNINWLGIIVLIKALGIGKLARLALLRFFYPKATITQIESFEKNTRWTYKPKKAQKE